MTVVHAGRVLSREMFVTEIMGLRAEDIDLERGILKCHANSLAGSDSNGEKPRKRNQRPDTRLFT